MNFSFFAAGALLLGLVYAMPAAEPVNCHAGTCDGLTKRTTQPGVCHSNNLLRNLRDKRYSVSASAFCSTYIQSTVTETANVLAVTTETAVITPDAVTVTSTNFVTLPNTFEKRAAQPYPTWLPATYPPQSVSSACSCFVSPSAPVTVTTTITTGTNTVSTTTTAPTPTSTITVDAQGHCAVPGCHQSRALKTTVNEAFTARDCINQCAGTSSCQVVQFGADGSGSSRTYYCNMFAAPIAEVYASGTSTDSYCSTYLFFEVGCQA